MNVPSPKILLVLGVPDGMTGNAAGGKPFSLRGNTGLAAALVDTLRAKRWPLQMQLLRPGSTVNPGDSRLLVNAVCEPVIHRRSLTLMARLEMRTGLPTLNPWWVVAHTGRQSVSRRLAHQNGVQVPRCTVFRRGSIPLIEHIAQRQHRYPVLLRPLGEHGSQGLVRADDAAAAAKHESQFAAGHVTDFVDFKSTDGLYRKYRMVYANDTLFRRHVLADVEWNLTGQARYYMYAHQEQVEAEKHWMNLPVELKPGSVEARILHQFRALQLDFGSVDFSLLPDGDIVIFEINACVQLTGSIPPGTAFDWTYLEGNNDVIMDALLEQIRQRAAAGQRRQAAPARLSGVSV